MVQMTDSENADKRRSFTAADSLTASAKQNPLDKRLMVLRGFEQ